MFQTVLSSPGSGPNPNRKFPLAKRLTRCTGVAALALLLGGCTLQTSGPVRFVDPFIGTAQYGHTFPGACVPFGMIQAGPQTGNCDWAHTAGYQYRDTLTSRQAHAVGYQPGLHVEQQVLRFVCRVAIAVEHHVFGGRHLAEDVRVDQPNGVVARKDRFGGFVHRTFVPAPGAFAREREEQKVAQIGNPRDQVLWEAVSRTLESAYDDHCARLLAEETAGARTRRSSPAATDRPCDYLKNENP